MFDKRFEELKNMEEFTNDMFNRIISFQEKEHAAWNSTLDFSKRIKDLPLHYLIFSSADRDPKTHGPTIAHYYPLSEEIQRISALIKLLGKDCIVCDLYAMNGFIGSLLAREEVNITGIKNHDLKPNQIAEFYDHDKYHYTDQSAIQFNCDVIYASWIPSGKNPILLLPEKQPKLFICTYTDHIDIEEKQRQCGTADMFKHIPDNYKLLQQWELIRPQNLLHEIWPDMTKSIEETRITRIYANEPYHNIKLDELPVDDTKHYDWEQDLRIASLALEAKQEMIAKGFDLK